MWDLQVLVSWWLKSQTKTVVDVGGLLRSRLRVVPDRRDVPHHRSRGHIIYYWTFLKGGSGEPTLLRAQRWPDYRLVHCSVLLSRHGEGGELDPN